MFWHMKWSKVCSEVKNPSGLSLKRSPQEKCCFRRLYITCFCLRHSFYVGPFVGAFWEICFIFSGFLSKSLITYYMRLCCASMTTLGSKHVSEESL